MADKSKIEWTDATWNPIVGCSVVSPGCTNCYAMRLAGGRLAHHPSRAGLTVDSKAGPVWNGEVRLVEEWLDQPLRWRRPRMIFVCAHGDLFHESVPDEWIDRVFAVMALATQHTFQVLTKRATRMRDYVSTRAGDYMVVMPEAARIAGATLQDCKRAGLLSWPLSNVWLGVSAEDQSRANERVPDLLATPATVRFVSAEPLLGPVNLGRTEARPGLLDALRGHQHSFGGVSIHPRIDWVIVGGESGPGARPMHPDWARSLRDQCQAAGVAFHFKQWGEFVSVSEVAGPGDHIRFPDGATVRRTGKALAGRTLDGRTWDEMPAGRHA